MRSANASSHCLIESMFACACLCRVTDLMLGVKCVLTDETD